MQLSSPFVHHAIATPKLMLLVCAALIPGAAIQIYFFGFGVLINLIACSLFAISAEYLVIKLRGRNPRLTLKDNSALVTGVLMGLALPPALPLWMSFIGVYFAIIIAKQLYGGLGYNPFNPAMVGYVLLLVSFPLEMTAWLPSVNVAHISPSMLDSLQLILVAETSAQQQVNDFRLLADGFTMATPLDAIKTQLSNGLMTSEIFATENFRLSVNAWMWVNLGFALGGLYLLLSKIIRWHIPLSLVAGIVVTSSTLYLYDAERYAPVWFHLFSGATMLGAFFIATDPVSAATTPRGRLIYGFTIGFFVVIIRTFGGYPEAMAFAVLLLNLASPTIDHYTQPVIYGHKKSNGTAQ